MILFFLEKNGGSIQVLKLMKLIWISDRYYFLNFGNLISGDGYVAMKNGPVPSLAYNIVKNDINPVFYKEGVKPNFLEKINSSITRKGYNDVVSTERFDSDLFAEGEIMIMNLVFEKLKSHSSVDLSEYSHKFAEWKRFESDLNKNPATRHQIKLDDFLTSIDEDELELFNSENVDYLFEM